MKKIRFGKTGLEISPLGFGAAPIGLLHVDPERAARLLKFVLDSGINLLDTAAGYQESEELIADAVGHRRDEYVLVSKCGRPVPGVEGPAWSEQVVSQSIDRSLRRLRTDRIDVMLLHSPPVEALENGQAIPALAKARDAGKIRFFGASCDNEAAAFAAAMPELAVVETSVNLVDQMNVERVLPTARRNDVGVLAKRPIANAAWKDLAAQPGFYQSYAKDYTERLSKMRLNPNELGISGPPDRAWPELALRFTLSQPGVHCGIIGTTNPDNVRANVEAAKKGPLPEVVVEKIRAAFRAADPEGKWTGQN